MSIVGPGSEHVAVSNSVSGDSAMVLAFLSRVVRRDLALTVAFGTAAGLTIGALVSVLLLLFSPWHENPWRVPAIGALCVLAAVLTRLYATHDRRRAPAQLVEQRTNECRNALIASHELLLGDATTDTPHTTSAYVRTLVIAEASRAVRRIDVTVLLPGGRTLAALILSALAFAAVAWGNAWPMQSIARVAATSLRLTTAAQVARIDRVEATITAPAYAALPARIMADTTHIDALVGSRIALRIMANADSLIIVTLRDTLQLGPTARNEFHVTVPADSDGFISIEPRAISRPADVRRLIALTVIPDSAPNIRIVTPGHDVRVRDSHATVAVTIEADDDIALASLQLRYTKVSGSGERFTFADGEVPITVVRASARSWRARVNWSLDSLALGPGDMVVYRAVTTDRRPGAVPKESDSYIAEVLAPGSDAIAGFSIDPDQERYAVSQQMVIVKTERLIAGRAQLLPDSVLRTSQELAAEQRKVRAEFVFMMGGEVADAPDPLGSMTELNEEAEAEGEADIAAGRLANQGRVALMKAIRNMSRAATLLTTAELSTALQAERAALAQLEQAFSRTRIILRALTEREQLDLSRRLSGTLTGAHADRRTIAAVTIDSRATALRDVLGDLTNAARALQSRARLDGATRAVLTATLASNAERVLRLDPRRDLLQQAAAYLSDAAGAISAGKLELATLQLNRASLSISTALAPLLEGGVTRSPTNTLNENGLRTRALAGALHDAMRGGPRAAGQSSARATTRASRP